MKHPRRRLTRVIAITTVSVVALGAAAVADTSTVPVTLGVVNGMRNLAVTGSNGTLPAGAPQLSFAATDLSAPLGIVVTDLTYDRVGYSVDATLSDLFELQPNGAVDCTGSSVPSDAFSVSFDDRPAPTDVIAVVEPFLTYVDSDLNEDLTLLGLNLSLLGITDTLTVTVRDLAGFHQELDASGLALMTVADGGGTFTDQAPHPGCSGSGAGAPTGVTLQTGAPNTPSLTGLATGLFDSIDTDNDDVVVPSEVLDAGLLPSNAATQGGLLWNATRNAVTSVLSSVGLLSLLTESQLVSLTTGVVADLESQIGHLTLDLVGQSGAYLNLPVLDLDRSKIADAQTGLYHGVLTVTLTDDTP